jgi:hypothetical protein
MFRQLLMREQSAKHNPLPRCRRAARTILGHPLSAETVLRRAPAARTADARPGQYVADRGPAPVPEYVNYQSKVRK